MLALLGMLALSSPGVRVARAGDGDATSSELSPAAVSSGDAASPVAVSSGDAAGVCRVGDESSQRANRSAISAQIAERLRAEMASSAEKPIVLNSRGYNYRIPRDLQREMEIVEAEATRQRERSPASR